MKGLIALPNGVFAGFTGKRICFSEPFLPHAWPVAYRITLEEEIVSIAAASNTCIFIKRSLAIRASCENFYIINYTHIWVHLYG